MRDNIIHRCTRHVFIGSDRQVFHCLACTSWLHDFPSPAAGTSSFAFPEPRPGEPATSVSAATYSHHPRTRTGSHNERCFMFTDFCCHDSAVTGARRSGLMPAAEVSVYKQLNSLSWLEYCNACGLTSLATRSAGGCWLLQCVVANLLQYFQHTVRISKNIILDISKLMAVWKILVAA